MDMYHGLANISASTGRPQTCIFDSLPRAVEQVAIASGLGFVDVFTEQLTPRCWAVLTLHASAGIAHCLVPGMLAYMIGSVVLVESVETGSVRS